MSFDQFWVVEVDVGQGSALPFSELNAVSRAIDCFLRTMTPTSLPDASTISEVVQLKIFDGAGAEIPFGTLLETQRTIVVFIRHFHCGICQLYVSDLAAVREESLRSSNSKIVVIGCGHWELIADYHEHTGFKGAIYADPRRSLFRALGMTTSLAGTPSGHARRSYIKEGALKNALKSMWRGPLRNLGQIGKQGNYAQLGGDFVFGPGPVCSFASRMQHTEDHVEVADLMKAAEVEYP